MAADDPTKAALPTDAQAPSRLFIQFDGHAPSEHGSKWNELYEQDYIPWDKGFPGPAFVDLLTEREDLLGPSFVVDPAQGQRRKKALVAGCGKGYDVLLLSAFGYDAYGLEISELALKAARESEKNLLGEEVYKVRDEAVGRGKITWLSGDFFKEESFKSVGGKGSFDLLYDYTVFIVCYTRDPRLTILVLVRPSSSPQTGLVKTGKLAPCSSWTPRLS